MTTSAKSARPSPPTADQIDSYRRDGFLIVRGLIPADVLDAAERGMDRFYARDLDAPFPGRTRFDSYDWVPAHGNVLRKNDYTSRMVTELDTLVSYPGIGAFAAALAGSAGIRLWHDQLLYKPNGLDDAGGKVGWHTDRQYWTTCSSEDMLTCWVPFHDVDETVGVVTFVPGSHRWDAPAGIGFFETDMAAQEAALARYGRVRFVAPQLERGDVTFHHSRTVHGSRPNLSDRPRRSMAIHLQPADNHWVSSTDADGAPGYHRNDSLVRRDGAGNPDYTDPRICPRLYPA
jgi:ectoine hydroxylase-related dioxygenase (phytanoyl-CoA dioxygenase family)